MLDIRGAETHPRRVLRGSALLYGLALVLAGCDEPRPIPYGFDRQPTQRFVLETEETTEVDGTPVRVIRYAEFDLRIEADPRPAELTLHLDRYYMRIEGAPGGEAEITLSQEGMVSKTAKDGEIRIGPDDPMPGGRTLRTLLGEPVAGVILAPNGRTLGDPWLSRAPVLQDLPLLQWVVLSLPILAESETPSWTGRRPLPPLGQYHLGMELPIRYERSGSAEEAPGIRSAAAIERSSVELAPGYRGALEIDCRGEAAFGTGRVLETAKLELHVRFRAEDDGEVHSRYRVRIRCTDCDSAINPSGDDSDRPEG